jgi:hypothetical protein
VKQIFVESGNFEGMLNLKLLDLQGKVVRSLDNNFAVRSVIEISDLPSGLYLLQLSDQHEILQQQKISIVH